MKIDLGKFEFVRIKYFDEREKIDQALTIYQNNPEFFSLLAKDEGKKPERPSHKTVIKDLELLPPGKDMEDDYYGLVYKKEGDLVGVLDLVKGYPRRDILYIGLFVIDKCLQGGGLGRKLYEALEEMARKNEFSSIMLGVLRSNQKGLSFWKAMGFREVESKSNFFELKKDL